MGSAVRIAVDIVADAVGVVGVVGHAVVNIVGGIAVDSLTDTDDWAAVVVAADVADKAERTDSSPVAVGFDYNDCSLGTESAGSTESGDIVEVVVGTAAHNVQRKDCARRTVPSQAHKPQKGTLY